jgi:hypothetical protein
LAVVVGVVVFSILEEAPEDIKVSHTTSFELGRRMEN